MSSETTVLSAELVERIESEIVRGGQIDWDYALSQGHPWRGKRFDVTEYLFQKGHLIDVPLTPKHPEGFQVVSGGLDIIWNPQTIDGAYLLFPSIESAREYLACLKNDSEYHIRKLSVVE